MERLIKRQILFENLLKGIQKTSNWEKKTSHLGRLGKEFSSSERNYLYQATLAIGQEKIWKESCKESLFKRLSALEKFYAPIGGIIGYQLEIERQLLGSRSEASPTFEVPKTITLDSNLDEAMLEGIKSLNRLVEFYPVGGAADRLKLECDGKRAPAAKLSFLGKPLIENLIRDLEAREDLYEKLFHEKIHVPIVMMVSEENDNAAQILELCMKCDYFGRGKENFHFVCQPLVPAFDREGNWVKDAKGEVVWKPGGHGVFWKLIHDEGLFEKFLKMGKTKGVVRQINNPVAGFDGNLIAFIGLGMQRDASFGFASCERKKGAQEGINVIKSEESEAVLSNVEFCDFKRLNIPDDKLFPANTNLLFIDLAEVDRAALINPFPGKILNFRKEDGREYARLECLMQNIVEAIPLEKTYLTLGERRKTISVTKRQKRDDGILLETPESCFYDILCNGYEVLQTHCNFRLPALLELAAFDPMHPPFIFSYRPSLGPLFSIIGQKILGGELKQGAELLLEISELMIRNLTLEGSLEIYGERESRCILKNVTVKNQGVDWSQENLIWKQEIQRREACTILLQGESEFYAENVTLEGNQEWIVPHGKCMLLKKNGTTEIVPFNEKKPIWEYHIGSNRSIRLKQGLG